ncbi:MAG: hypothetical protein NZ866_00965 [Patescibacteria group bacterium]|nr:hypothetical protein [Patescibacteria group bacterium]
MKKEEAKVNNNIEYEKYLQEIIAPSQEDKKIIEELENLKKTIKDERLLLLITAIINFLSASIVKDVFENHNQRRKFISFLPEGKVKNLFLNNRLRVNVFFPIFQIIETYQLFYNDNDFREKFEELFNRSKNYNEMTLEEKLFFIEEIRDLCFAIAEKIKSPSEN